MDKGITYFDPWDKKKTKKKIFPLPSPKFLPENKLYRLATHPEFQFVFQAVRSPETDRYRGAKFSPIPKQRIKSQTGNLYRAMREKAYRAAHDKYQGMVKKLEDIDSLVKCVDRAGDRKAVADDLNLKLFQVEDLMAELIGKWPELIEDLIIQAYWRVSLIRKNQGFFEKMGKALQRQRGLHQNNDYFEAEAIACLLDHGVSLGNIQKDGQGLSEDQVRKLFSRHNIKREPTHEESQAEVTKSSRRSLKPKSRETIKKERVVKESMHREFGEGLE